MAAKPAKADKAIAKYAVLEERAKPWWRRLVGWIHVNRRRTLTLPLRSSNCGSALNLDPTQAWCQLPKIAAELAIFWGFDRRPIGTPPLRLNTHVYSKTCAGNDGGPDWTPNDSIPCPA